MILRLRNYSQTKRPGKKSIRPFYQKQLSVDRQLNHMLVESRTLVPQAFAKIPKNAPDFGLVEGVEREDKGIGQDEVAEARECLKGVHPDNKNPCEIAHPLHILNIWPIDFKHLQQLLYLLGNPFALLLI